MKKETQQIHFTSPFGLLLQFYERILCELLTTEH